MAIPRILNNDPLTTPVPLDAPYYAYYLSPPIVGNTSLGRFDHKNQFVFKFIGYNAGEDDPYSDDITYNILVLAPPTSKPPAFVPGSVIINNTAGWINGTLNDIGNDIVTYELSVQATTPSGTTSPVIFQFTIVGGIGDTIIDDTVTWNTGSDLGTIDNGALSDLSVSATFGTGSGMYRLVGGSLPPGLEVLNDGNISGRVEFNLDPNDSPYTFTIEAYDPAYPTLITANRTFTLGVVQRYSEPYDTIYMGGLLSFADRASVKGLLDSITATQESNIYRPTDPYFGVADNVRYQHQYGVPSISATSTGNPNYFYDEYWEAVQRNFYWKFLTLGSLKTAIATDSNGNTIYEVVYCDVVDDLVTSQGVSISKKVGFQTPITTNIGPYWTSWTTIYTSNTYYDLAPLAKALTASITSSTTMTLNNVDGLVPGMQVTAFPGVSLVNQSDGTPPVLISVNQSTNTVTLSVAQTLINKQQIMFNIPIAVSNGDVEQGIDLYPNSLPNMREQIADIVGQFDNSILLPRWMNTQQPNGSVLGYIPCWVLCYTKPGKSAEVLGVKDPVTGRYTPGSINRYLADNNLTLNQITFQIDRITIDRTLTSTYGSALFDQWPTQPSTSVDNNSQDSYIQFPRKTILY